MSKSLLDSMAAIVAAGKRQAEQILEQLEGRNRVTLQTRELVVPSKDTAQSDLFASSSDSSAADSTNRLIYGDNLLAMTALLGGDERMPSMRGKVDLIYIDPPFDSKADYRTKITLPGTTLEQKPTVMEQFAYSDTWSDGTASYLAMITPRLLLMRELLAETGSIYVHLDWHVGHYVKAVMDEVFGKERFVNDIVWKRTSAHNDPQRYGIVDDRILFYTKSDSRYWSNPKTAYEDWYVERYYRYVDEKTKRRFLSRDITGPAHGGTSGIYEWKGKLPGAGRMWAYTRENMERLEAEGRLFYTENGIPRLKQFLDEMDGAPIQTIWVCPEFG